jgi:hypothetical protein
MTATAFANPFVGESRSPGGDRDETIAANILLAAITANRKAKEEGQ